MLVTNILKIISLEEDYLRSHIEDYLKEADEVKKLEQSV
jgi:hypothetical protein